MQKRWCFMAKNKQYIDHEGRHVDNGLLLLFLKPWAF